MPLTIVQKNIVQMPVDAVVNAANTELVMGGGVCGAIFRAAGMIQLQEACARLAPIKTGEAVLTDGFHLPAKYIIHTAGPIYDLRSKKESEQLLYSCYLNALNLAKAKHCQSIAFPLISSGIYGYPKVEAEKVAVSAIHDFLVENTLDVYLTIWE